LAQESVQPPVQEQVPEQVQVQEQEQVHRVGWRPLAHSPEQAESAAT
jgi:hypothetical protein